VASRYRELKAYRVAVDIARDVRADVLTWESFDRWTLGRQLTRAAESVGANIAEAEGRWHAGDRRKLLLTARGSLYETEHWIARAKDSELRCRVTADRISEAARLLNGMIKQPTPR
jgi:four helix bundle protein